MHQRTWPSKPMTAICKLTMCVCIICMYLQYYDINSLTRWCVSPQRSVTLWMMHLLLAIIKTMRKFASLWHGLSWHYCTSEVYEGEYIGIQNPYLVFSDWAETFCGLFCLSIPSEHRNDYWQNIVFVCMSVTQKFHFFFVLIIKYYFTFYGTFGA